MTYCAVATNTVTDECWTEEYTKEVTKLVESFGGKYVVRSVNIDHIEGVRPAPEVVVVMQFPSKEDFMAFYHSDAYKPYLEARKKGSAGEFYGVPWVDEANSVN